MHLPVALGLCAILVACGSKSDEGGPAVLKQAYYGEISPFDTLKVAFDQAVQKPADSSVISAYRVKVLEASGSNLVLVGADTTLAGFPRFAPGVSTHMVTLKHVVNGDGDEQSQDQVLSFTTLPFLDKDYTCEATLTNCLFDYLPEDGVPLMPTGSAFFNGASPTAGVKVAGLLMLKSGPKVVGMGTIIDNEDHYLVQLKSGDSIEVKLSGYQQPVDITLLGSQDSEGSPDFGTFSKTDSTKGLAEKVLLHKVGVEHGNASGTRVPNSLATFAIKVGYHDLNPSAPTPYVLSVRLISRQYP